MRNQIRSDLLKDVFVENEKGTKFYKGYATSEWVYIPENFQELKELLLKRLQDFKVDSSCDAWIEERNLFATKEEAQKECDKRNGKGGK